MDAAVCLTLAGINLFVWLNVRREWAHLFFSSAAIAAAGMAAFELLAMRADSIRDYAEVVRWAHVPFCVLIVSVVWFARVYMQAGRTWLAWTITVLRTLALAPNFLAKYNLNYKEITALRQVRFLGEDVSIAEGVLNPWMILGQLSSLLLLVFLVDASITVWKRGERRRACLLGGSLVFFILLTAADIVLVQTSVLRLPYMISFTFFGLILAMAFDLSRHVLRASRLIRELEESEYRMSLAANAAKLGVWVKDLKTKEIWASGNWRRLLGFTESERLDLDHFLKKIHPHDRDLFNTNLTHAISGGGYYETDYRVLLADGQTRWIASRGQVEFNGGGKPTVLRGVSIDITERKQAEMEVLQQRGELTHLSRVTMLGELSGSLAHELNQPLTAILSNAQAAQRFLAQDDTRLGEVRDILKDIVAEDKRAGEVIRRLRLLLKKGELQKQEIDVHEVVEDVLHLIRSDLVNQGMTVKTELAAMSPIANADRVQLQQVLLNLVLNACDVMARDSTSSHRLVIGTRQGPGEPLLVSVSDDGTGIAPENLEKIFDPFFTTKAQGMGLGLSICRTIITTHGGKLWAANNPERGATFHFTLPAHAGTAP